MAEKAYGAIELGGTKTVAILAKDREQILEKKVFPTLNPIQTMQDIFDFFNAAQARNHISIHAIGVGSFGPLDLNPESETFGYITSTPKKDWEFFNIKRTIEHEFKVKTYLDTDVNTAALGEYLLFPVNRIKNMVYITVGSGIGAGIIINSSLVHGLVHPEFGHMRIPHNYDYDPFPGLCPYHQDCLEGLASGPALTERWQTQLASLPKGHIAWQLEAEYISYGLVNLICTISPEMIVIGGSVMSNFDLYDMIRHRTRMLLNKYIKSRSLEDRINDFIVPPRLNQDSGILGALCLAMHSKDCT